ncbi:MAG: BsaA family SipW-dependent biofilm matrix protein [Clostridiales Family XIII bacterium]|jgi:predicted ribosomally synthesized peptide with SipW-like signal peptide|nr:BsaA family SipW-dependent biofilm matrix protein [Clostridiales Family XIII bacterium]
MKKTLSIGVASALAIVMVISATFAWFTAKDSVTNHLETSRITDGSAGIVEIFTPPKDWVPGQTITKEISVANNGSGDIFARISFEEVMKSVSGAAVGSPKSVDDPSNAGKIPQLFNADSYLRGEWKTPSAAGLSAVNGLPDGVEVRVLKKEEGSRTSYSFVALYKIKSDNGFKDSYQRVTADFDADKGVLTVSNVTFWDFGAMIETKALWADFNPSQTGGTFTAPPAVSAINTPITDKGGKIKLNYSDEAVKNANPQKGKWWYSSADGYFYYIGKIEAGSITNPLLDSLSLDPSAGSAYSNMKFDLIANMEAIQNTEAALVAVDGWNIGSQTKLLNALKEFCA